MPPPPAQSFNAGAVRLTLPEGYREHTRFVLGAPGSRLTVSRFDDRAATPTEIAEIRRAKGKDMTDGAASITRAETLKVAERPAEVTVTRVKESSGQVVTVCTLLLELAPNRFADLTLEGIKSQAMFDEILRGVRVGGAPASAGKGQVCADFIELTAVLPVGFVRSTPYTFSNPAAGIEWEADSARVESPAYARLGSTVTDTLSAMPGAASRDYREGQVVGVVRSADVSDPELGGAGDRLLRAEVFLAGGTIKLVVQGRSPRAHVGAQDKDILAILKAAVPAGGA
ncbi:hypothetical protein PHYC_02609 [Phycisphaerales bacterium]|nr:hypothetical protein PHYC_02609 [Phycisphaerales bacterium]